LVPLYVEGDEVYSITIKREGRVSKEASTQKRRAREGAPTEEKTQKKKNEEEGQ